MKFRRNKKDFFEFENDRKTHVKLYKAGKQWVSSLISSIGLIRVFKGKLDKSTMNTQLVSKEKDKKSEDKLSSDGITAALKGAAALGAVAGGTVLTANTALADTKQLDSNQNLVNKETVNLSSGSGSSSVSDSLSTSESNVQTEASVSKSESVSLNTNTNSSSTSETRSDSNSRSESISESKSDSNSQSVSSQTTSKSESLASTSLENSQTTTGTTAKDKLQGLINQATDFVNSDAFKSSSSDLKPALAAAVKQYATVMQSSTSLTEQDYQYGIDNLALLMNEIKSPSTSIKPNIFMANNVKASSDWGTLDKNTSNEDTPALWYGNYKWIVGDSDRLWTDIHVQTSRNTGQSSEYVNNNVTVDKEELGNGQTKWKITFYPKKGIWRKGYDIAGLEQGQMGFYLTKDYKIISDINVHVSMTPGTTYQLEGTGKSYTVRNKAGDLNAGEVNPEVDLPFKTTDINTSNGAVDNGNYVSPYFENDYVHFVRYADRSVMDDATFTKNVFEDDGYDKLTDSFAKSNELANAGLRDNPPTFDLYDGQAPFTSSFNRSTIGSAMYMESWGNTTRSQDASYTVTFTTEHSNKDQAKLAAGANNGSFSGIYAIVNSYQNGWTNLQGQLVGQEVYNLNKDNKTIDSTKPSELTSKSNSESESTSKSESESTSKSGSVSTSQSESTSSSLSESLSKSSSLSESTSTSSSLSESLSKSSSLSESTSTSSSLSESLSTSSSLSESLSTSSSLSESLSTSSSLSESLSTSSSLSESLSTSSSLSESLSTSSSLSESLSTSSSLSESLSTSSSLSESLSTSSSLSESLSTSSSLSESLSTSSSLSESLSTSSSLSESLSTSSSLSES
ncbi:accessory Sec-dependent serine-rich glycoprotein adhesin, partial [Ligilactobacillus salivarius]|uniref:accessory Sec-dependent serine-rich glycoprotein adhesin n=1 Tax=Ligilactobacillus salivarius TaxID=1624 RepID=UPI00339C6807